MANQPARVRMCAACRSPKPQNELFRIVKTKAGEISVDAGEHHIEGRGAYLCQSGSCIQKAQKERRLERALRGRIDGGIYQQLGELHEQIEQHDRSVCEGGESDLRQ